MILLVKIRMSYLFCEVMLRRKSKVDRHVTIAGIIGALAKFRKVTISFVITVCLSIRTSARTSVVPHETTRIPLD